MCRLSSFFSPPLLAGLALLTSLAHEPEALAGVELFDMGDENVVVACTAFSLEEIFV
jgi:hypothetical protein